jgi:ABC-type tungstate transport system permease subunit
LKGCLASNATASAELAEPRRPDLGRMVLKSLPRRTAESAIRTRPAERRNFLSRGDAFGGAAMVSALWLHGPDMLDQMKTKGIAWPRFEGTQMADLIAYLNTKHP